MPNRARGIPSVSNGCAEYAQWPYEHLAVKPFTMKHEEVAYGS